MTDKPKIRVWITKYALTEGIIEADAEVCDDINQGMIRVNTRGSYMTFYHKPHWHVSPEEARLQVSKMLAGRLKSLRAQIVKLERLAREFEAGQ